MNRSMNYWRPKRARAFLLRAAHERAKGPGLSETTLTRLARLQDSGAAESHTAFVAALRYAGWSGRRIEAALAEVTRRPAIIRWMSRNVYRLGVGVPATVAFALSGMSTAGFALTTLAAWLVVVWEVPARGAQ